MNEMFGPREILEEAADRWWIFLVTGIAWLVFALLVFQWDYTTVYAISILFGVVAIVARMNEFFAIASRRRAGSGCTRSSACSSCSSGSRRSGTRTTRSRRSPRSSASSC